MGSQDARIYRHKMGLLVLDVLSFLTAFVFAMHLRFFALAGYLRDLGLVKPEQDPWSAMLPALPVMICVWLVTLAASDAYRVEDRPSILTEFGRVFRALLFMSGVLLSLSFFVRGMSYSRAFAIMFSVLLLMLTFGVRLVFRALLHHVQGRDDTRRALLVGSDGLAARLAASRDHDVEVVGVLDDRLEIGTVLPGGTTVLGRVADLAKIGRERRVRSIFITDAHFSEAQHLAILETCMGENLEWNLVPQMGDLLAGRAQPYLVSGVPVIGIRRSNIRGVNRLFKRIFDILGAAVMLAILSPLMVAVALLIKLTSKGPVLFSQQRVGENGQPFSFYKFRSMHVGNDDSIHREYTRRLITEGVAHDRDASGDVYKIANDPRLIPVGAFIRRNSIDELPQLINVLKGDMSLIGPRPPIPYEVEAYREWHKRRFEAPPGITGLWQVSGRSRLSFEEMVKLDIEYLENWSFARDLRILWQTLGVVLLDRAH